MGDALPRRRRLLLRPPAPPAPPSSPEWLPEKARPLFAEVARHLQTVGVFSEADRNLVARYALLFTRWLEAERFLEQNGSAYPVRAPSKRRSDGSEEPGAVLGLKTFPQVRIARDLSGELLRLEDRIGLSPWARAKLSAFVAITRAEVLAGVRVEGVA